MLAMGSGRTDQARVGFVEVRGVVSSTTRPSGERMRTLWLATSSCIGSTSTPAASSSSGGLGGCPGRRRRTRGARPRHRGSPAARRRWPSGCRSRTSPSDSAARRPPAEHAVIQRAAAGLHPQHEPEPVGAGVDVGCEQLHVGEAEHGTRGGDINRQRRPPSSSASSSLVKPAPGQLVGVLAQQWCGGDEREVERPRRHPRRWQHDVADDRMVHRLPVGRRGR